MRVFGGLRYKNVVPTTQPLGHEKFGQRVDPVANSLQCSVHLPCCYYVCLVLFDWYDLCVTFWGKSQVIEGCICGLIASDERLFLAETAVQRPNPVSRRQNGEKDGRRI